MKITKIETFLVDAGWRPWIFVKIETDEGITGYGECSEGRNPYSVVGAIRDFESLLLGKDPRAFEMRYWDLVRGSRQSPSGIVCKAIAGIDNALLDIKARALDISVVELFGGPTREEIRLYWSHCGTSRAMHNQYLNLPPLHSLDDITALGKEVVDRGYSALKTNIILPGDPPRVHFDGFGGPSGTSDQIISRELLAQIDDLIGAFQDGTGPDFDINLDLNFNFKPEACMRIAQRLEKYDLLWLELDMYDPYAIRQIKESTTTKICTGENLFTMREFIPYFENRAADVFMIDVMWNGFSQSKKIGDLADVYQFNVAPHNFYSHLATNISASLCAVLPNVRIMEIDVDDVPWREELTTNPPEIVDGIMKIPSGPGWGTELNEEVAKAHQWENRKSNW